MDRSTEFKAEVPTLLKDEYGIKRKPITTHNTQANAMVEHAHQTIHNLIASHQVHDKDDLPMGLSDEESWMGILSAVAFAICATIHTTTQATPTQLVFNHDAILNVEFQADWEYIKEHKQKLIIQNNKCKNKKRQPYVYQVGDKAFIIQDNTPLRLIQRPGCPLPEEDLTEVSKSADIPSVY